ELHANFKLSADGDYLALVMPDGTTIASSYTPTFPPQRANVSYGQTRDSFVTTLIAPGTGARVLVPTNNALDLTWTVLSFDDSTWLVTNTPVGFNVGPVTNVLLALDFNKRTDIAMTQSNFTAFIITSNTSATT